MSIHEIQDSIDAKESSSCVQMSPLLSEVFDLTFKKATSTKPRSHDTSSGDQPKSLSGRTAESQLLENSSPKGSRPRTNDSAGGSSNQSISERGALEQGQSIPRGSRQTQEEMHSPHAPRKDNEQTPAGGSGILGTIIRDAINSLLQFRPLHIYPESIDSSGKPIGKITNQTSSEL